jgi:putative heme-binding domain, Pirellula/Verrucomicrobium type
MRKIASAPVYFLLLLVAVSAQAENPQWIWHDNHGAAIQPDEFRYFRKTFEAKGRFNKVLLSAAADDDATIYINGKEVAHPKDFSKPVYEDVTSQVKAGRNVIAVRGHNISSDVAGVLVMLELKTGSRRGDFVVSDDTWLASEEEKEHWRDLDFDDSGWSKAKSKGKLGDQPWGNVLKMPVATPADSLTVLPGFKAELVKSSEIGQGSWICMATDPKGRLIISPQDDRQPLLRMTLSRAGKVSKIEPIPAPVHQAMGLLYAHDSLYVNGHGPSGTGLYRLIDANHNDKFETNEVHFLKKFEGEGEHGYHAVVEGPDKMIYVMNGNHTKVPQAIEPNSPHKNYQEDFLLARQWDANGHAVGILAPGGYVLRTDPEGKKWELMLAGFRNSYDFDFNADGEMFTFDSDMEWDWGLPWYRPTRINHCVLGAEFGWRSGSADWPDYYADSLPPTINIGVGSPTGVKFGTKSNFPEKYRKALFIFDWSYGRIFAVHLKPDGASYSGEFEVFLKGKPLNLTDLEFGKDGAMYFITGGRGTQSGLYRVSYVGPKPRPVAKTKEELEAEKAGAKARAARHTLEAYIGKRDPRAVDWAWPYLRSPDRFLNFAARMAIESQPVERWKDMALLESNTDAALNGLLSLARCGGKETQRDLLSMALKKFPLDSLSVTQKLQKLRIIELSFIRQGKPDADLAKLAIDKLDPAYPSDNEFVNRELSQLLIYLEATNVVTKTLALLDKAPTQEEQVHYIFYLRNLKNTPPNESSRWGQNLWTLEQRKHYFDWFRFAQEASKGEVSYPQGSPYLVWTNQKKAAERHPADLLRWFKEAGRDYGDGASYPKYLANIRKDAIAVLTPDERIALNSWIEDYGSIAAFKPTKERQFVKEWTVAELENDLPEAAQGRNFASGKAAYNDAQCIQCHRLGNEGGSIGPELTALFSKYSRKDILESIIEPSKVVSDQFQNYIVTKKDGDSATGKIIDETADKVVIQPNPLSSERIEINKSDIAERKPSKVSPMPQGLLNNFTKDEILDLLGYLESMGKEKGPNFKPVAEAKQ